MYINNTLIHSMIQEEKRLWTKGYKYVAGIDEAGRGPLAGPVVASAVFIPQEWFKEAKKIRNIRDSKQLSEKKREEVFKEMMKNKNIKWGIGIISEKIIDRINILEATKLAMIDAIKDLEKKNNIKADYAVIDGKMKLDISIDQGSIIKGDDKVFSISAASIIAKVTRDEIMIKYDKKYPDYNFKKHKGYGTKEHIDNLKKHGKCSIHRKTFLKNFTNQLKNV